MEVRVSTGVPWGPDLRVILRTVSLQYPDLESPMRPKYGPETVPPLETAHVEGGHIRNLEAAFPELLGTRS